MASLAPVARLGATLEPTDMARLACLAPTLAGAAVRFATPDVSPGAPRRVAGSASPGVAALPARPAGPAVRLATPAGSPAAWPVSPRGWPCRAWRGWRAWELLRCSNPRAGMGALTPISTP